MVMFRAYVILFVIALNCSVNSAYKLRKVTGVIGNALETANWSVEEQTLYFIDFSYNTFYRLYGATGNVTKTNIGNKGGFGLILPLNGSPGYVIVAIQASLYIMNCNAPCPGKTLRLYSVVDVGKPDNRIHEARVDAAGRLWFGTLGKPLSATELVPDQGTLYVITNETHTDPRVALRPVSLSDGLVWSLDNKQLYFNDGPTRKIARFDYNLKKGEIGNQTTFFDFEENNVPGLPNGITIDSLGNIWVATYFGAEVLRIDAETGKILLRVKLPVDQATSITWGGENLEILYITTGRLLIKNPKPDSGSLFSITCRGCRGVKPDYMTIKDVENY